MSKRSSIGSWAYTIGPYASNPIDFDTVCTKLKALGFDAAQGDLLKPATIAEALKGCESVVHLAHGEDHALAVTGHVDCDRRAAR